MNPLRVSNLAQKLGVAPFVIFRHSKMTRAVEIDLSSKKHNTHLCWALSNAIGFVCAILSCLQTTSFVAQSIPLSLDFTQCHYSVPHLSGFTNIAPSSPALHLQCSASYSSWLDSLQGELAAVGQLRETTFLFATHTVCGSEGVEDLALSS